MAEPESLHPRPTPKILFVGTQCGRDLRGFFMNSVSLVLADAMFLSVVIVDE